MPRTAGAAQLDERPLIGSRRRASMVRPKIRRPRRKPRRRRDPAAELDAKLDRVEAGTLRRGFAASRDAMAAVIVVRAIERASELAAEKGGSRALRKALDGARAPMAAFLESQLRTTNKRRSRKKA